MLWMRMFLLYFLWRLGNTFHSIISPLPWFLYSSFWLGLYRRQVSAPFVCEVFILVANNKCCFFFPSCQLCHSNKLESLFECEVSRLLYDEGEVEYWMYQPVDLTEQSSTNAEGCECECSFCISRGDLETLSIGKFMSLMLCPWTLSPLLKWLLHSSFWQGLYRRQVSAPFVCGVNILLANNKCCSILFSCQLCHSNKLESLFECEVSHLLYNDGEVEYWMYEPVDLTEQSSTNAATNARWGCLHCLA